MIMGIGLIWFDFLLILTVFAGCVIGKKRGMSGELEDTLQWLAIVIASGLGCVFVRDLLINYSDFGRLTCSMLGYLICALTVKLIFSSIRKAVGHKLVEGDFFGRAEYILGCVAGGVRFFCILFFLVSLLQSKMITEEERQAVEQSQQDSFESIRFPTLSQVQYDIRKHSFFGRKYFYVYLEPLLIEPARNGGLPKDSLRKKREEMIEKIK